METCIWRKMSLAVAAVLAIGLCTQAANAGEFLWISAPNWSYSAAAADSPVGWAYFWGLSAGAGTYSFAYAYSDDGAGDAAYAYAEASAGNLGGEGSVDVSGLADPYAGIGIETSLTDPSNTGDYPQSKPGTDPFTSSCTVSGTGITLSGSGSELNGLDGLEAFTYPGGTDLSSLEAALGVSSDSGTGLSGDVTDIGALESDFGLIPLDPLITDPGNLTGLTFTENDSNVNPNNVILVGQGDAESPEPATFSMALLVLGGGLMSRRRRQA